MLSAIEGLFLLESVEKSIPGNVILTLFDFNPSKDNYGK